MRKRRLTTNTFLARSAGISQVRSWRFRTRRLMEVNPDEQLAKSQCGVFSKSFTAPLAGANGSNVAVLGLSQSKGEPKHAIARQVKRKAVATLPYDCT